MKLEIDYTKKTGTIKQGFNRMFPFLKIEFFNTAHAPGEPTSRDQLIADDTPFGKINGIVKEGSINIHEDDSVAAVEQSFQQKFGLAVQVFRKQNNVWIETTKTDQLTLAEQNEKGKAASTSPVHTEPGDRYLEDGQY